MANTWYVAPDLATTPGVTPVALGTSGYAGSWASAAKWSDFNTAGGVWQAKVQSGDTIVFLAGRYLLSALTGGWATLGNTMATLTLLGQTVDGKVAFADFVGTRTSPWPRAGNSAATLGETFMNIKAGVSALICSGLVFHNVQYPFTPNASNAAILGTLTQTDCAAYNTAGGLIYTQAKTDGQLNLVQTRCKVHGYSKGNARVWGSVQQTDCVLDSEFQSTSASRTSATNTSGAHVYDSLPGFTPAQWPSSATRSIYRNHAAGSSGGGYGQGDGFIGEENTGVFTGIDILGYGSGDRDLDMKCGGNVVRASGWGSGTGLVGHHMDQDPLNLYQCVAVTGTRTAGSNSPSVIVQSSGLTNVYQSALVALPTAAQVANNPVGVTKGDIDPSGFQSSIYGSDRRGVVNLFDCWLTVGTTVGASEQVGYTGSADNARVAAIPGLTPGNTYNLKVRALAQDGSASAYTGSIAYTMDAAGTGDTTPPATPTGLTSTGVTSSTASFSWNRITGDAGTQIIGYIFRMKRVTAPADAGYIYVMPGKSASPITFSGLAVAVNYLFSVAAYDANGNIGTFTSDVSITTSAGSNNTSTPSVPLSPAVPSGWTNHPNTAGLQWNLPSSGTVAYYEVADNAGNILVRCYPIPGANNTPSYAKTNVTVSNV